MKSPFVPTFLKNFRSFKTTRHAIRNSQFATPNSSRLLLAGCVIVATILSVSVFRSSAANETASETTAGANITMHPTSPILSMLSVTDSQSQEFSMLRGLLTASPASGAAPQSRQFSPLRNLLTPSPRALSAPFVGEVTLTATAGTATGTFTTLGAAFTAINAGTHQGVIVISINADTAEGATTATLNASGTGSASYTSIGIQPVGGAARTISGTSAAGSPMIDLSGADNVTIDGLNAGGNSLTISNAQTSTTASTSTIRFINDATSNTIQNATINGAAGGASTGTILFSTTTGATGNDNNTVTACSIGSVGATFPANSILSSGTTTSTTTRNSGIQITNNKIFDFFTNTAVIADGILASGSTDFTITGNSFYQTATRTMTVAASGFIGISINDTSGVNFVISNNFIGGSTVSAGSTAWTQTGAVTHTFIGIRMAVGSATVSSIQNNRIQNINISSSTASTINAAISAVTGAMNIGTTTGNTIGATTGTGSITFTGAGAAARFSGIQAGTGTPNGINISNNNIGSITIGGAGTTVFYGIRMEGAATAAYTASGNTIGSTLTANSITSNSNTNFAGISGTQTLFPATVANNTIQNLQNTSAGTSASLRGIELTGSISGQTISGNTIRDFSTASTSTSTTTTSAIIGILFTGSSTSGNTITTNTIRDLSSTTSGATAVYNQGIVITSTPGTTINRNFIFNLTTAATSTSSSINGIQLFNSSATENIYNNMMRLGLSVGNNPIIRGIYDNSASTSPTNIYFNSIYIDGTQGAATVNTACISKIVSSTMDVKDNILWNNRASTGSPGAGTGRHYGIQTTSGNPTSNYNDIYTPNNGGAIGFSTSDQITLANWRTATSQDLNSQNSDPKFQDATNATTPNLHINPSITTLVEGNGLLVSPPTDDFDGQTRSTLTPVDIGADAGNFTGVDLTPPVISYTALANSTNTTSRTLTISVTDASGVPTAGAGLPVLYYRKGVAGAYSSAQCTFTGGSSYDCVFTYSVVGGVIAGDTIQYYVAAQDSAATPNVTTNPSTGASGFTANPPAATTPTTGPNSFLISALISGDLNVGTAETFKSLTVNNAQGVFKYINDNVVNGNIIVHVTSNLTLEDGAVALNDFASPFTVTIKPDTSTWAVSGAAASTALIRLNGASRVTFDGSTSGGTDRSLSFENTSATTPGVFRLGSIGTTPIVNDAIKNCTIRNGVNTSSAVTVLDTAGAVAGYFNNITIQNNDVQKAFRGLFVNAVVSGTNGSGLLITGNSLNTAGANSIRLNPIFVAGANGVTVSNNTLGNISDANAEAPVGIFLSTGTDNATVTGNTISGIASTSATSSGAASGILVSAAAATSMTVSNNNISTLSSAGTSLSFYGIASFSPNVSITNNTISGMTQTGSTSGWGIVLAGVTNNTVSGNTVSAVTISGSSSVTSGIQVQGASTNVTIEKNKVFNIKNTNSGGWGANGIWLASSSAVANTTVKNNFVYDVAAFGFAGGTEGDNGYGIIVSSGAGYNIYNNSVHMNTNQTATTGLPAAFNATSGVTTAGAINLRNNIFANTQTVGTERYSIYSGAANTVFSAIDFNDYFTAGPNLGFIGSNRATLADIVTGFGGNANSKSANPQFASATDLHLTRTAPGTLNPLEDFGISIAGVTTDFDNDTRATTSPSPDIGADEVMTVSFSQTTYRPEVSGTNEGDTAIITVNRTSGAGAAAVVNFTVGGGSAVGGATCGAGVDYITPASLVLNFAAADTSKTFNIVTCTDGLYEGNETVPLALTSVSGDAIIGTPNTATVNIIDGQTQPTATIGDVSQAELNSGTSTFSFLVTLSGPSATATTINYTTADISATAGSDYVAATSFITIPANTITGNIPITVNGDTTFEPNETFKVTITSPDVLIGGTGFGTGTIVNDDVAETDVTVTGGNLVITDANGGTTADTLTISRNGANVRITDPNNTLTAGAGATQIDPNTVEVPYSSITGNIQVNTLGGNDTLTLNFAGGNLLPVPGGLSYAGGTQTSTPGDRLVITGGSQGTVTYNYTSGTPGAGNIVMSAYGTVAYVGLEPISNSGTAADVIFNLPAGPTAATLADDGIGANGMSRLSGATFETTDFSNPTGSLTINRGNAADTMTVNALPDFNANLSIGSGAPFATITVSGAVTVTGAATVNLTAGDVNSTGAIDTGGGLTISNTGTSSSLAGSVAGTGGLTKNGTGRLDVSSSNGYSGPTVVNGGRMNVNQGVPTATTVNNGATLGGIGAINALVTVNSGGTLSPGSSPGILAVGCVAFSSGSTFDVEIGGTIAGNTSSNHDRLDSLNSVTLGNANLNLSSFNAFVPIAGQSFLIIENQSTNPTTSGTFNGLPEGATITNFLGSGLNATITYAGGSNSNDVVLTVLTPDVSVVVSPASVLEDGATNLDYTFTRTNTGGPLTITFLLGGTAAFGTDYTQTGADTFGGASGTVTFAGGSATAVVSIDPTTDATFEADETVILAVTAGPGYNVGSPVSATGTITNDDACAVFNTVYVDDDWVGTPLGSDPDGVGPATSFGCDSFATIQGGVNGVAPGGTVNVAAGNYPEQVVISKSLTLTGAGAATTNITTPATLNPGLGGNLILVQVDTAAVVNMSNITVAGPRVFNACSAQIFYGVYVGGGANLNLHDAAVKDIRLANPSLYGCQDGIAIRAGSQALGQSATLTLTNDTISGYQKGAVIYDGTGTSGTVQNSIITGFGLENLAQNAIQIGRNAGATLTGNTITGNECSNPVCGPDPLTQSFGTGVLIFSTSASIQINNNTISSNDTGIYNNAPNTTISGNTMAGNRYNGIFLDEGNATVTNNTLSGVQNVGVAAVSYNGNGGNSSGTLTGNTITGATTGLSFVDETNADAFVPLITAHFNRIVSTTNAISRPAPGSLDGKNQMAIRSALRQAAIAIEGRDVPVTVVGRTTPDSPTVAVNDLQNNWWGCNAGPGNTGCGAVGGTAPVDFDPWFVLSGSATPNVIIPGGTSNVAADMTKNSDGAVPAGTLPDLPIGFSATNGTMNPTSGTVSAGAAASTFTSTNGNSAVATLAVDNQNVNVPITVNAPAFSIDDVTHLEGSPSGTTSYVFTVTKTGATGLAAAVNFSTVNGTATLADNDYQANSSTLNFGPSDTTMPITVLVNKDTNVEPDEAFTVHLDTAVNATISDADGTGTITNDDLPTISGRLTYQDDPTGARNVTMTLTGNNGFVTRTTLTDNNGDYAFTNVPTGNDYVVTPSRLAEVNDDSITAFDASLAAQYAVNLISLTTTKQTAGDSSNNGTVTAFDASQIARYDLSIPTPGSIAGAWKFSPTSLSFNNLSANQTSQNGVAILVGDVSGNWTPNGPIKLNRTAPEATITVALPNKQDPPGGPSIIPITVSQTNVPPGVFSFDFDMFFDPAVLQLQSPAFDTAGTLSAGWGVNANTSTDVNGKVHLILNAFSTTAMTGQGQLIKLKFNVVGGGGSTTPLTWAAFNFNEGDPADSDINGTFTAGSPSAAAAKVSGQILTAAGQPVAGATVTVLGGATVIRAITDSNGYYKVEGLEAGGFYTVTPARANFVFAPASRSFSLVADQTDAVFTGTQVAPEDGSPLESPEFFVRQQYLDFLGREPEQSGLDYWSGQLRACTSNRECINQRRMEVSAAFFIAQEFQESGLFIYDLYEGALGRQLNYAEYSVDKKRVVGGPRLEADKAAFALSFVERAEFQQLYPLTQSGEVYVDALLRRAEESSGLDLSGERASLLALYNSGGDVTVSRATVLRTVVEGARFKQTQYNAAFVLMEYLGYLGRNPDREGYEFWLNVLNSGQRNNYGGMVCSFITSAEYQRRFSSVMTRSNAECATLAQAVGRKQKAGKTRTARG